MGDEMWDHADESAHDARGARKASKDASVKGKSGGNTWTMVPCYANILACETPRSDDERWQGKIPKAKKIKITTDGGVQAWSPLILIYNLRVVNDDEHILDHAIRWDAN